MSIDLTKTLEALQRKINSFDSTGDEYDLKYLLKAALRGERSTVYTYATEGDLPNLLDDSAGGFENEMLVYAKDSKQFYFQDFQNKLWKPAVVNYPPWLGSNGGFVYGAQPSAIVSTIRYFPFANPFTSASAVGNLTTGRVHTVAARDYINEKSYICGGTTAFTDGTVVATIDSHPNATQSLNVTNVGSLSGPSMQGGSASSMTDAYVQRQNGTFATPRSDIDKVQFSDGSTSGVDFGDLFSPWSSYKAAGITDAKNQRGFFRTDNTSTGYISFPFSSEIGFVGSTFIPRPATPGTGFGATASDTYGYVNGGGVFEKFPFASGSSVTDIAPLNSFFLNDFGNGGGGSETAGFFWGKWNSPVPFSAPGRNGVLTFPWSSDVMINGNPPGELIGTNPYSFNFVSGSHF